ncbi:multidrug ABC transporter ATPase [Amycolatopsis vancoresmycina DSM 44592]|uniref:Multidrug ABC transporter ATPase n=1 Tax=Amycolatopsis vancoresmycina DSM 44592 TaxID=1292037 RepID=R1G5D7_9PSEU|nr:multidrug ABC transporter ATPase [Amycolatopsis vancoresmycina DSM 44592]
MSKRYGGKTAVDGVTFTVKPGVVTGFLGPNGAGKSTTIRMIMGLDAPTSGSVTVNGKAYARHPAPLREVGALPAAEVVHTGRSAYHHLLALVLTTGIPRRRVDEVLDLVGLADVARRRVGGFSLGTGQRLGVATALLGDPATLVLDEPVNGLDPQGIRWIRNLLRRLAAEGRTVFVSSHLMSEMALTAEHLVVIGKGRLIADTPVGPSRPTSAASSTSSSSATASKPSCRPAKPASSALADRPGARAGHGDRARPCVIPGSRCPGSPAHGLMWKSPMQNVLPRLNRW